MAGNNVPGLDSAQQFSQNVPGVQFPLRNEFGKPGEAEARTGEDITTAAEEGGKIINDRAKMADDIQRQHDVSTAGLAAVKFHVQQAQLRDQTSMASPDGMARDPNTGEILDSQASPGGQQTIAESYWGAADQQFRDAQQNMTPRQAAMFREQAQKTIMDNTQLLQGDAMRKQVGIAKQNINDSTSTFLKDFQTSLVPTSATSSGYYTGPTEANGSQKEYPSQQKLYDAVDTMQKQIGNHGPTASANGILGADEVAPTQQNVGRTLALGWMQKLKDDMMDPFGSRAAIHKAAGDGATTVNGQIDSAISILEGTDPQSLARAKVNTPGIPNLSTVNSLLTADDISKLRNDFNSLRPTAKAVDKHDYELQLENWTDASKSAKDFKDFMQNNPLTQKVMVGGKGLGLPPAEQVKNLMPGFKNALLADAMGSVGGLSSTTAKTKAAQERMINNANFYQETASVLGVQDVRGFADAIGGGKLGDQVAGALQEDHRKMDDDPRAYAAKSFHTLSNGQIVYDSPTAHALEAMLDPNAKTKGSGSVTQIFDQTMPNGKSLFYNAAVVARSDDAKMFSDMPKSDHTMLSLSQFKDQASRIKNASNSEQVENYFQGIAKSGLSAAEKSNYMEDLVLKGDLPRPWIDAWNMNGTPEMRKAQWASLRAGEEPMPDGLKKDTIDQEYFKRNASFEKALDMKFGPASVPGITAKKQYREAWSKIFIHNYAINGGDEDKAASMAQTNNDAVTSRMGLLAEQHSIFNLWKDIRPGPQVPMEYGSPGGRPGEQYTDAQKQTINDTLLHKFSAENLSKYKFPKPPGALPDNPNAPSDAKYYADQIHFVRRFGNEFRPLVEITDKNGNGTGAMTDLRIIGHDGKTMAPLRVTEDEALGGPPAGSKKAVPPIKKPVYGPGG